VDTVRNAENRRQTRFHGFNVKRNEYLCPLCETIGNTVLPIFPELNEFTQVSAAAAAASMPPPLNIPSTSKALIEETKPESNKMDISMTSEDLKTMLSVDSFITGQGDASSAAPAASASVNSLSYDDWLSCLEKTLENSIKKEQKDDKDVFVINPCPLSTITKLVAEAVAENFKLLFERDTLLGVTLASSAIGGLMPALPSSNQVKLHGETVNIMENYTRNAYTFGFNTLPNDEDSRMPISVWTNCAYTIQIIGKHSRRFFLRKWLKCKQKSGKHKQNYQNFYKSTQEKE
jgi:hypothetical protein